MRLWKLDLCGPLPRALSSDGIQAVPGELARIRSFLTTHFSSLTEEAGVVTQSASLRTIKHSYLNDDCDLIELAHDDQCVGVLVGAPEDWSSYYIRTFAVRKDFQRRALIRVFLRECVFDPLANAGVQRVTAETSPMNRAMTRLFGDLKFYVTGHQLSERWGPLVRYTKYLDPTCESLFLRRFGGAAP